MLEKINNTPYLDAHKMTYGSQQESLAYMAGGRIGTAVNDSGFIAFRLRDVNGYAVPAIMFNVREHMEKGFTLAQLRKRPVKVKYVAGEHRGGLSLTVVEMEPYTGEFDYEKFLGFMADRDMLLIGSNDMVRRYTGVEEVYRERYKTESYLTVCNGQAGGYVKLIHMVMQSLVSFDGMPGIVMSDLMTVASASLNVYARYLDMMEHAELPLRHECLSMVFEASRSINNDGLKNVLVDAASALCDIGKPTHLYAHLIVKAVRSAQSQLQMVYEYPLVVKGGTKYVNGELLARY